MNKYQLQHFVDGDVRAVLTIVASDNDQARLALLKFAAGLPVTGEAISEYALRLLNGAGEVIFKLIITGSEESDDQSNLRH